VIISADASVLWWRLLQLAQELAAVPASAAAAFGFLATVIKDYGGTAYFSTPRRCFLPFCSPRNTTHTHTHTYTHTHTHTHARTHDRTHSRSRVNPVVPQSAGPEAPIFFICPQPDPRFGGKPTQRNATQRNVDVWSARRLGVEPIPASVRRGEGVLQG
jgi:hypothetical protein